jgi:hypothetical protein
MSQNLRYCEREATGLLYTYVPRVSNVNVPEWIDDYIDGLPVPLSKQFKAWNVKGNGNCGYYVVQLYLEWRFGLTPNDGEAKAPPVVEVATFRQQFRQYLQDVGRDYFRLYLPSSTDHETVLNRVYDPTKLDVDDYYNKPPTMEGLPEKEWARDDDIYMMARWAEIDHVVIFSKETLTIADISGDDLPGGNAPQKLFLDPIKDGIKLRQETFCDLDRINTLFIYYTGCHYIWLKVDQSLIPNGIANRCIKRSSSPRRKSPRLSAQSVTKPSAKQNCAGCMCAGCMARNKECILCMVKQPSVAFIPCGHVITCKGCMEAHQEKMKTCPSCRTGVEGILNLYL